MFSPRALYLLSRCLCSPLEALFTLLIFILSKKLNATPLQLTLIACLKPITSLFAFYACSVLFDKRHRIRNYLIVINLLACIPCFFYPMIQEVWFYIASYALYMITMRAVYPAWIEILKGDLDLKAISQTVSQGTSIYYFITIFVPPLFSIWMDQDSEIWRYLFFSLAGLQMSNTLLILLVKIKKDTEYVGRASSLISIVVDPLKQGWKLFVEKPQFAHYQILFFLGGAGIIGMQPILPIYFNETLHLSYTQLALAFSFCKGVSYITTCPFWARYVNRISLYTLNCYVNFFSCLSIALILAAVFGTYWLYLAYLFYGTMQAGCEMSWNLSGPIFSEKKESTIYSSLNLVVVGVRGCICPFMGHLLFINSNASTVFTVSFLICLIGIPYGLWLDARYKLRESGC